MEQGKQRPDPWYAALPRAQFATLKQVDQPEDWFQVYELPGGVYAICEPGHFQEVISFLVTGEDRGLLIDTGMGIGDIKKVTDFLWDKPLLVVNTHSHFDHMGGNHRYDRVQIRYHPAAERRMQRGWSAAEVAGNMIEGANAVPYPAGFDPSSYYIRPCAYRTVADGHVFDLGGRRLELFATPGHSPDSVMLADHENKLLFTGDTVYPATLYAHLDSDGGPASDTYRLTMDWVADWFSDYTLYCSHNEPIRPGSMLREVADGFLAIREGSHPFEQDEKGLKTYRFQGFAILTK